MRPRCCPSIAGSVFLGIVPIICGVLGSSTLVAAAADGPSRTGTAAVEPSATARIVAAANAVVTTLDERQ